MDVSKYKIGVGVTAEELRGRTLNTMEKFVGKYLYIDTFPHEIADRIKEDDTICVLDVTDLLDENDKLFAGKISNLPSSVRHLSFINGSRLQRNSVPQSEMDS
eukprot:TRINITY_DN437_c0_g1_i4.p2 TRINITY_DN437_c0_g1~~TRINITY_DN437_c0_g1_i4.p2  ORF type:complete len:103 (+),score=21.93 TRINITY_DN437_c0_g1_i4:283-591(+)